ncbi:phosphatidate cytidylyltransferase [Pararoseomonas indoligenes]|uniref:Phosphatidate cytidylyltransferase n=1 Tax=Roseomonas indoligenes TaxID=2820811 RepID=A0A940MTH3_9PROT|nr:phosphatidate cytidylyltransferase [Pararoseomonas indoligenes]MBP0493129.1 phosphatidate cytidylyltransferase [Pararoseomonas indoligenes]
MADPAPGPGPQPGTRPGKDWRDLRKRVLSALVLGPAALLCVWLGANAYTLLLAVAAAILTWEWVHLCGLRTARLPGAGVPAAVFVAGALSVAEHPLAAAIVLVGGFLLTWAWAERLRGRDRPHQPALRLALGVLYIGVAFLCLIELRHENEAGRANLLFLLLTVWASDIGGYVAGRAFGGPKLWPQVSPGKTWTGAAGGLLLAMAIGAAAAPFLAPGSAWRAAAVAAVLAVATQAGDLFESAIKRQFKVKDTSSLIPGHGGLLDRLDGLLAAAPAAMLLAIVLGYGGALWR